MGAGGGGRGEKDPLPDFIRGGEALYLEMFQTLDFSGDFGTRMM